MTITSLMDLKQQMAVFYL